MFRRKPRADHDDPSIREKMPPTNTAVTLTRSGGPTVSGTIVDLETKTFRVRSALQADPGSTCFVNYQTGSVRHRFGARCLGSTQGVLSFAYPDRIETVSAPSGGGAGSGRQSVRLDTAMRCEWRAVDQNSAPAGFSKGSLVDISATGASLTLDAELPSKMALEVRLALDSKNEPLLLASTVMRVKRTPHGGKFVHGLQFHGVSQADERAIVEFINRRQTERRQRGLL